MAATMVQAKPRGPTASTTSPAIAPQEPQLQAHQISHINAETCDSPERPYVDDSALVGGILVRAYDSMREIPLEELVEGTLMTPRGSMVSSAEVVRVLVGRLQVVLLACTLRVTDCGQAIQNQMEDKIEATGQLAAGVELQAQVKANEESAESLSVKLEAMRVKHVALETAHNEQQQVITRTW